VEEVEIKKRGQVVAPEGKQGGRTCKKAPRWGTSNKKKFFDREWERRSGEEQELKKRSKTTQGNLCTMRDYNFAKKKIALEDCTTETASTRDREKKEGKRKGRDHFEFLRRLISSLARGREKTP